jgi:hypothetical protein
MPDNSKINYPDIHTRDAVAQGRMILIGIAAAFLCLWIIEFVTYPAILIPGFLYDRSLRTAFQLLGYLVQFGCFSAFCC